MAKTRVFELAKELRVSHKELMDTMASLGIYTRSHMSVLENGEVIKIRNYYRHLRRAAKAAAQAAIQSATETEGAPGPATHVGETNVQPAAPQPVLPQERPEEGGATAELKQVPVPEQQEVVLREKAEGVAKAEAVVEEKPSAPPERSREVAKIAKASPGKPEVAPITSSRVEKVEKIDKPEKGEKVRPRGRERREKERKGKVTPLDTARPLRKRAESKPLRIPKPPELGTKETQEKRRERPGKIEAKARERIRDRFLEEEREEERLVWREKPRPKVKEQPEPPRVVPHVVLSGPLTVQELAKKLNKTAAEVIKKLMSLGVMATINQELDVDTAAIAAQELGAEVEIKIERPITELPDIPDDPATLKPRPPVVTVMGHVDHGKTSLLDAIRHTNVTATEAGGITQHIGAYQVTVNGRKITFLDTPGHEAFTAMRARGAQVTDIAVLVVAADDGVMPQTVEAINHAKAANVPIIVAINKIDKPDANPERIKQQLTEYELVPEEWGGDTIMVPVSALKKQGLEQLLEMILLVADLQELKANPDRPARGVVIEAKLDRGRGPVATVLVQKGTLKVGDTLVAGSVYGRVRAMLDDRGNRVQEAPPSTPVEILGLNDVPEAGDIFQVVEDEKLARQVAEERLIEKRQKELQVAAKTSLDEIFKQMEAGQLKELKVILKADVQGSVEALRNSLERLSNEEVKVNIIHSGVGAITETDVMLAAASKAIIIGFQVRPDANARKAAEGTGVEIRLYRVIYEVLDDIKAAMVGLLEPEKREVFLGRAEVRATFKVPKVGTVAGCYVSEGKIVNRALVRLIRDGVVIYEGRIASLKRFKDDVREVAQGFECGIGLEKFNDIKEGDIIEAYTIEEIRREL
ncbi:bacterial translation initiation factor 2 (bIF-2) [Thermanaeromonas toyohensis ToBE]|uniref:Translation initiation factor IF-2 n=1 Tax=Thermanaeromonas toyohensis ToBE TaxID=698762 RepID=A0A1W1VQA4_9FIRM|nr:translation initiation factor IF-2 [Thermanaeromonas toyohensis]SMB95562.1 bacterial translation initiation factor 2 (bIF-2) [Thermanaeromonas toyohensis ToBE]